MPLAQLITQRLRQSLAARGPILSGADPMRAVPLLEVELTNFEQVFDASEQSHGLVAVRATLTEQGRVIAQREFIANAPAPTGDAPGGARERHRRRHRAVEFMARRPTACRFTMTFSASILRRAPGLLGIAGGS